jgi:glycosyltransferase involved in cell wall biosynthesis
MALVHYWYTRRRGGERVLDALADTFPNADIFLMVLDRKEMPASTASHRITTSFLQKIPGARRHYQKMMMLFPAALESFNLDQYEIVISHEAGPAKGVLTRSHTCHINYCHSPMRHIWEMYHEYKDAAPGRIGRLTYAISSHYLRVWDACAANRVDQFVASSLNAESRIWKYYRRQAELVYPPVDLTAFESAETRDDYYLVVSPLVAYKRIDLAIEACNRLKRKLVVIGQGEEERALRKLAGPTIQMMGYQSDEVVRDHYKRCRAFLFPGEEDIGLTPIEAQASGAPVIAFGRGGALETVRGTFVDEEFMRGSTGIFFDRQSPSSLTDAILWFEANEGEFLRADLQLQAAQFSTQTFQEKFCQTTYRAWQQFNTRRSCQHEMPTTVR